MADPKTPKDKFDASATSDQQAKKTRTTLKVLRDEPQISPAAAQLMEQHRTGWKQDHHIANPETHPNPDLRGKAPTDEAQEVQDYYAWMATIDPSSADFATKAPAFTLVPMPRGGLQVLAERLIPAGSDDEKIRLRELLYRLNKDTLRTSNRYTLGQAVRIPTETVEVSAE